MVQNNAKNNENYHRQKSADFLNNANTQWRYLIGSYHRDSVTYDSSNYMQVSWEEKRSTGGYGTPQWTSSWQRFATYDAAISFRSLLYANPYKDIKDFTITMNYEDTKHQTFYPSDGVVLVKSQKAFPGVGNRTDKMPENNHFQERNSTETERVMKKLYRGDYDLFFQVDER